MSIEPTDEQIKQWWKVRKYPKNVREFLRQQPENVRHQVCVIIANELWNNMPWTIWRDTEAVLLASPVIIARAIYMVLK